MMIWYDWVLTVTTVVTGSSLLWHTSLSYLAMACAMANSVAPPPGSIRGSNTTLRTTCMASERLRSISFNTSLDPPRNNTVQALASVHFSKKAKYSSPILRTNKTKTPQKEMITNEDRLGNDNQLRIG